jgi:L-iditol 2-dehydrogenase
MGEEFSRWELMRAAVLSDDGRLRVEEIPLPPLDDGDMLLRTLYCGLCGSDLYKIRNRSVPSGTVLGHEVVGVVERCPPQYEGSFPPGTLVTVSNHVPCGSCGHCARGRISSCEKFRRTSFEPGGFAEWIRVPNTHLPDGVVKVPDGLPEIHALLAEPFGCCIRAAMRWGVRAGQRIMVIGLGPMGIMMSMVLSSSGAWVMGVETLEERRRRALEKGCKEVCDPKEVDPFGPFEGVVLTACNRETLALALRCVEPGGWIGLFAGPSEGEIVEMAVQRLYKDEVDLIPSYSTGPEEMRVAISMMKEGTLDPDGVVSHLLPIEDIELAVEMAEARVGLKTALRF